MSQLSLPISSYRTRATQASTSRLVNCYPEQLPPDAKTPAMLLRAPGIVPWTTVGNGPIAGLFYALGYLFVISGSKLYKVDSNKTATLLGDIGTPGNIDIDANTTSIVIVNDPDAYYYDGTTFGQITDADFTALGANSVEFLDNFLLFTEPDSDVFFGADLGSATSFDALNFASAEGAPDNLLGMKVDHRQAILLGAKTLEIWDDTGSAGFPFQRAANGFVEIGCLNAAMAFKLDQSVCWPADDYTIRKLQGTTAVRISTHAVEQFLTTVTMASGRGYSYTQDGHLFGVFSFPEGTYVYDATTQEWHERQSYGYDYWIAGRDHTQAFGLEIVGDATSNRIGYLSSACYDEWGSIQRMEWTYQPVLPDSRNPSFHDRLDIIAESGVGLTTGQGSAPEMMLDYSDDGGKTWLSMPNKTIGAIGDYQHSISWARLGSSRKPRVFRAAVTDPVQVAIRDTQWTGRGGRLAA
jgi:hypothetical protein